MSRVRLALGASLAIVAAPALLAGAMTLMHSERPPTVSVHTVPTAAIEALKKPVHPLLGAFEGGFPRSYSPVSTFGKAVGHHPSLVLMFTGVGRPFPSAAAEMAYRHGATLLLQINPGNIKLRKIASRASGWINRWLSGFAKQVARFGHPVIIGFGHEMNGKWYHWGYKYQPPQQFVAAWKHIVDVFRHEHASGAIWLWTISHHVRYTAPLKDYWPGPKYVDMVGIDGYYTSRSDNFGGVFGHQINRVRAITDKPILLSEIGIGQVAGQTAKIPGLFVGMKQDHLAGLVWFDLHQSGGLLAEDWRLEGHQSALTAFRQGLTEIGVPRR